MLPAAAARRLLPVSVSMIYVIYKYLRYGRQTESWASPNCGNNDDVPPNSNSNNVVPSSLPYPELSDGNLAIVEEIPTNDRVLLDKIRTLDPVIFVEVLKIDPVILHALLEINLAVLRDSAELHPAIIDAICKLSRKEEGEEEADRSCSRRVTVSSLVIGVPSNSVSTTSFPQISVTTTFVPILNYLIAILPSLKRF